MERPSSPQPNWRERLRTSRLWRFLPLIALALIGTWFLNRAPQSVELELDIGALDQGLRAAEVSIALLPEGTLVLRSERFFSATSPAPEVISVRARLQRERRYRVAIGLQRADVAGRSGGATDALEREFTYQGEERLRLFFR